MDTKELLKRVRKIEIKTRRLSDHIFGGEYHSTFKGRGMTFSEVRQYQFGDDVRTIDWNVTARYNEPYVKVFEEERELWERDLKKRQKLPVTDKIELFIPPKKGRSHVLRIIRELIEFEPQSSYTDLGQALKFLSNVQKKKAIVFIMSDFLTDEYKHNLKISASKHDLTGIRIYDRHESDLPNLGMVQMLDEESGEYLLVNTASKKVRRNYNRYFKEREDYFRDSFAKSGAGTIHCRVDESYVRKLLGYFKQRG